MKHFLSNIKLSARKDDVRLLCELSEEYIDFKLPRLAAKPKGFDISTTRLQEQLDDLVIDNSRQVQEGGNYLDQLNRYEIKTQLRLDLTDLVLNTTSESIANLYRKYLSNGTSLPESNERKTALTATISLLRNLMQSYKTCLAADAGLPVRKLTAQIARVDHCAVRIMELTLWLQRLLALRFQKLSAQEWKDFNALFFIYEATFDASKHIALTPELALFTASGILSEANSSRSVFSLFVSVQIFGSLDITSWPSNSNQTVEQYLHKYEGLIDISIGEPEEAFQKFIISYADLDQAPVFSELNNERCCYINLTRLDAQIEQDIEEIHKKLFIGDEEKKRMQPQTKVAELSDNQGLLSLLRKMLSESKRGCERQTLYGSRSVDLYSGFSECYRLLFEMEFDRGTNGADSGFHDAAARHSSLLVDNPTDELECQWLIVNESETGILMRTNETRYMHAIEVGEVVALRNHEDSTQADLQIGYITRLDRSADGQLDVALVKMSVLAEAVGILEPGHGHSIKDQLSGILIQDLNQIWQIILPRGVSFVQGSPVIIKRKSDNLPVRLGESIETKNGFITFEVRSPVLK